MLMDSKGKLFGKISIVDFIVIILVILAIFGSYLRFGNSSSRAAGQVTEFYYEIFIKNIRESNKYLLESSIGTEFRTGGKSKENSGAMGELVDIEVEQSTNLITKTDGTVIVADIPEKYDVTLTMKVKGKVNDSGFFTSDSDEISVRRNYTVQNIYSVVSGVVTKVWKK